MGKHKSRTDLYEILGAYARHARNQKRAITGDDLILIEAIEQMVKDQNKILVTVNGMEAEIKRLKMCLAKIHWMAKKGKADKVSLDIMNSLALEGIRELDRDTPHH